MYASLHEFLQKILKHQAILVCTVYIQYMWVCMLECVNVHVHVIFQVLLLNMNNFPCIDYICYDDGCHLRKFARHSSKQDVTPTAQKLASVEIVIDKMHMAGHVDKCCLENCDPHLFSDLDRVSKRYTSSRPSLTLVNCNLSRLIQKVVSSCFHGFLAMER